VTALDTGDRWRAARVLRLGDVLLLPVERMQVRRGMPGGPVWMSASLVPAAVVVREGGAVRALDAEGRPMSIEEIRRRVPDLDALLDLP
jgi:hypothetical protein